MIAARRRNSKPPNVNRRPRTGELLVYCRLCGSRMRSYGGDPKKTATRYRCLNDACEGRRKIPRPTGQPPRLTMFRHRDLQIIGVDLVGFWLLRGALLLAGPLDTYNEAYELMRKISEG